MKVLHVLTRIHLFCRNKVSQDLFLYVSRNPDVIKGRRQAVDISAELEVITYFDFPEVVILFCVA